MIACPNCGSTQVTANKKGFSGRKAVAGVILTGGIGLLAGTLGSNKVVLTCLSCGRRFKPGQGGRIKNIVTPIIKYRKPQEKIDQKPKQLFSYSKPKEIYSHSLNTEQPIKIVHPISQGIKKKEKTFWPYIIVLLIIVGIAQKPGCNKEIDESNKDESSKNIPTSNQTYSVELTKDDSTKIKQELSKVLKAVDAINVEPRKSMKQFSFFTARLRNYSSNIYQVFQAAKIAKQKMDYAEQEISDIRIPEILPKIQRDSLSTALSAISSSYSGMSMAFYTAMDGAKHPSDNSYAEAFGTEMNQASEMYAQGLSTILQIQIDFGISKKKKHRK